MPEVLLLSDGDKPQDDAVFVALTPRYALVKIQGRGSFKVSPSLKQFGEAVVKKNLPLLLVDMSACIGMDSTFMGVLAGVANRMKPLSGRIVLVHCTSRTRNLLATLGLDQLITSFEGADTPAEYDAMIRGRTAKEKLDSSSQLSPETSRTMLEAHEALVDIAPGNMPQFKDVLTFLREEVSRKSSDTPGGA
jgi:anti-sigma B factor antagonist